MLDLSWYQLALIALIFVWSGFVRSGLGFGGAMFTLPFLLLIHNDPLVFLPIISLHLLFFASITIYQSRLRCSDKQPVKNTHNSTVNWWFVRYAIAIMLLPKIAGVVGLLVLPVELMNSIIFSLIAAYSLTYIADKPMRSNSRVVDIIFLVVGAYISGTSLIGAPLIIAVALRYIQPHEYRNTLFVLWFFLVSIKLTAFAVADVNLQLFNAFLLLPFAGIGHFIGMAAHSRLLKRDSRHFYRTIGWILLLTSSIGMSQIIADTVG